MGIKKAAISFAGAGKVFDAFYNGIFDMYRELLCICIMCITIYLNFQFPLIYVSIEFLQINYFMIK